MPKTEKFSDLALGPRAGNATLFRWLYDELRTAIVEGRLRAGARLPSSRSISRQHQVSRGTVVSAFEQLGAEGYVDSRVGSGSFVRGIPDKLLEAQRGPLPVGTGTSRATLSARGRCLARYRFFPAPWLNRPAPAFRIGQPALGAFPIELWSRVAARRMRKATPSLLSRGDTLGFRPLRVEIASYLGSVRGIKCTADEIVITSGTQQSLDLVSRLLLDRQDKVWVENPGYPAAISLFRALGVDVVPVPVDDQGLVCAAGRRLCKAAKLAYVTPAHQFPLGVTLSLARRLELLQWAQEADAWIVEDDYDGEFRFTDRPLVALRSLDASGCVIYSNTFNKVLFPTLRLGYLVLPQRLIEPMTAAKAVLDRYPPVLDQAILCDFITEGHMGHHIRRMREIYMERLDVLARSVQLELDGLMELAPTRAGLQTVGWLAEGMDDETAYTSALARGIESIPLSRLTSGDATRPGLILGFAAADSRVIRRGVEVMGEVLRDVRRPRRPGA